MDAGALHPGAAMPHLRRPGSFPGDQASVLSPRSSETGALGVNMAEYVLGGSPVNNRRLVQVPVSSQAVLLMNHSCNNRPIEYDS